MWVSSVAFARYITAMRMPATALALLSAVMAVADGVPAQAQQAGNQDGACAGKRALGVSRVLEIDTTSGPRFGHQQYKDHDFLRPGEVVLTFDDGPLRPNTKAVLDALAAHCTRATFFMVGRMALADPELVREVARRGHTVGTHTLSHANMRTIGASRAEIEIEAGINAVSKALGRPVAPFFRFPFLADSRAMIAHLGQRNIGIFSIDVDAVDYRAHTGSTVHRNVMLGLLPLRKGILLFHDIQPSTAQGLINVLDDLATKGYKVVHLMPKAPAVVIASYDQKVGMQAAGRSPAVVGHPVAGHPMAPRPAVLPPGQLRPATEQPTQRPVVIYSPQPAAAAQPLPAPTATIAPPTTAAQIAPRPPVLRGTSRDDDWRQRVFNN